MGLLDEVVKSVTGGAAAAAPAAENSQASLANVVLSMLANQSGGLSGLVQQFTSQGLGHIVNSWIGTGQNLAISPQQLNAVLGSDQLKTIATRAGLSPETAQSGLAQLLPQIIDRMTPNGEMPQGDLMAKGLELLKGKLL